MQVAVWSKSIKDPYLKSVLLSSINNVPDGWVTTVEEGSEYTKGADVDVIFGSWKLYDVEHHNLKRQIVKGSKNVLIIETPLLGRGPVREVCQDRAFRVGMNGFMSSADWPQIDGNRLEVVRSAFDIPFKPKKVEDGNYILIPLQLPGDASLQGIDINKWMKDTVSQIREITDRKIVLRTPQIERNYDFNFTKDIKDIYFQKGTFKDKQVTLDNAYAVVTYSSGMSVEALLNGNRTYVESNDGFASNSQGSLEEVLQKDYKNFKTIQDYKDFKLLVCSTYWTVKEIKEGLFWEKFECLKNH